MFNKETAIGMLRQGNNGEEILSILDAIVADEVSTTAGNVPGQVVDFEGNPTEFWYSNCPMIICLWTNGRGIFSS